MKIGINEWIKFLAIKAPVVVKLKTERCRTKKYRHTLGTHTAWVYDNGKIKQHLITIYLPNLEGEPRGINTVVAHELIHASISEKFPRIKSSHGPTFQYMCGIMEAEFGLRNLFIHGTDLK